MKNAGSILKEARLAKRRTIRQIAEKTRIKEKFLIALEECDWDSLPGFSITQGFANSFAQAVDANPQLVAALLRRDYPQAAFSKPGEEMPLAKPSLWTPKTTLFSVIGIAIAILGFYLVRQYILFAAPPSLQVSKIEERGNTILVSGKTAPTATIDINHRSVLVESDGSFQTEIESQDLINSEVQVKATSRTGKTTTINKKIQN
jgi:cytoskeletal protein RodZ